MIKNIFILENRETDIKLYKAILKDCVCNIHLATSFNEALDLLKKNYDLYILDVNLNEKEKTGMNVLDLIPEREKIIMVSGIDATFYLEQNNINIDFLFKPFDINNFKSLIKIKLEQNGQN